MVEVCLRLAWYEELDEVLKQFPEDDLGPLDFARALLGFARTGSCRHRVALLSVAVVIHPGVAENLVGAKPMPRPDDNSPRRNTMLSLRTSTFFQD